MTKTDIVSKIEKLLALAESSEPAEAALAASRAQELMMKYAIEDEDLNKSEHKSEPIESELIRFDTLKIPRWQAGLMQAMAPGFFCKSYLVVKAGIQVVGRATDRAALIATWTHIRNQISIMGEQAWAKAETNINGKSWKTGYYEGAVMTIAARLEKDKLKLAADNTGTAIVLTKRLDDVNDWVKENVEGLRKSAGRKVYADPFDVGRRDGWAMNLNGRSPKALKE